MKTILVITDHTAGAERAALFALMIAQAVEADILIADAVKINQVNREQPVIAGARDERTADNTVNIKTQLESLINPDSTYIPVIAGVDISDYETVDLTRLINANNIWLVVKGMPDIISKSAGNLKINIQSVLNRVQCPVLLIPQSWAPKPPQHIVYIGDLRYCLRSALKFLAVLAAPFDAGVSIAHLSAKDMVHIVDSYADTIFREDIIPHLHYEKLSLNNTKERDLHKAVDVLINSMHNDIITLVNHRHHFKEIIGGHIGGALPAEITVPVLIFPL